MINKILFVLIGYILWITSQKFINVEINVSKMRDKVMESNLNNYMNNFLREHPTILNFLFIITSLYIDISMIFALYNFIFTDNIHAQKFMITILFTYILRQLNQFITNLPVPRDILWHYPGFPSIFVTYDTVTDFFFSGHTAFSTAILIFYINYYENNYYVILFHSLFCLLEISLVLWVKVHYFIDVYTAIVTVMMINLLI